MTTLHRVPAARPRTTPWRSWGTFLLLAGPNVALLVLFVYKPLIQNVQYSLLHWNLGSDTATAIGLENYRNYFSDPKTPAVLLTTLVFAVVTVGGCMAIGLALARLLDRELRGRTFVRAAVFAPYVLSGVAVGMCWLFVFDPQYGLVSGLLRGLGLTSPNWYNDPDWALAMVCIVYLWKYVGYVAIIYLAALQSVPGDLLEAAQIDGASPLRTFWSIVFPLLSPTTLFLSVTVFIESNSGGSFDIIRAMTKGGPLEGTTTMVYQVYQEAFVDGSAGYASAIATLLFLGLLAVTLVQMVFIERKVHYR
ncbi:carbohydrate ABC transporter permease [Kineococcus radiotolerans]|uniref:Binding-protein-dependent transport systems inner membrane component n=1 Tax=Kineococcus radiotolerans (strain ATCC BAA-149 / DSM 14245 / SRS30216) TaxID=266940 RepID=A6W4P6_KINRD|nr:sugar ABC transporter permease [Kineococcus radiotolerans]ABS01785.1 binding-protein-dependent transport systems inner membrane component [Kineococcus radiotolerans SRS30216 = ATCC BAA-149]